MAKQGRVDRRDLPVRRTGWAWAVATFGGVGFLRPGPGTYGSAATVLLWALWVGFGHPGRGTMIVGTALAALVVTLVGIPASTIVARESGRKDPGFVVIDEVAGQLLALLTMPPGWGYAALALLLFRLFDITKPWPVRRLEALPEGTGIMLDDVAAGLLACATGWVVRVLLHR